MEDDEVGPEEGSQTRGPGDLCDYILSSQTPTGEEPEEEEEVEEEEVEEESTVVPIPLPSVNTFGMSVASYNDRTRPDDYSPMTWITFQRDYFTENGFDDPKNGNYLIDEATTDRYESLMIDVALRTLEINVSEGTFVDGDPVCIDPEDNGFDKALFYHDLMTASRLEEQSDPESRDYSNTTFYNLAQYNDDRFGITGRPGGINFQEAFPRIRRVFKNVKAAINLVYPNTPVGWYSVGPGAYWLTGWGGTRFNSQNPFKSNGTTPISTFQSGQILNRYFSSGAQKDPDYIGWKVLEEDMDFCFNPYYPAQNDRSKSIFTYFNNNEYTSNFFYLYLKYFVPNAIGSDLGDRMMIGISTSAYMTSLSNPPAWSNQDYRYITWAQSATEIVKPDEWLNSTLTYPDTSAIPGLIGSNFPGFIETPFEIQNDLIKWMFDTQPTPDGYQTNISSTGVEADPDGLRSSNLPDQLKDMKVAIWDPSYTNKKAYTKPGEGIRASTGRRDGIASGAYDEGVATNTTSSILRGILTKPSLIEDLIEGQAFSTWLPDSMDDDATRMIDLFVARGTNVDYYTVETETEETETEGEGLPTGGGR